MPEEVLDDMNIEMPEAFMINDNLVVPPAERVRTMWRSCADRISPFPLGSRLGR